MRFPGLGLPLRAYLVGNPSECNSILFRNFDAPLRSAIGQLNLSLALRFWRPSSS
jgi:hypothetical protein